MATNPEEQAIEEKARDGQVIVSAKGLSFAWGSLQVLQNLDFEVREGELVGVVGPNGGGKSTLLKLLMGVLKPSAGEISVFGSPPDRLGARKTWLGYLPQRAQANWDFPVTVKEVVLMGSFGKLGIGRGPSPEIEQRALELLAAVDLADLQDRPIGQLSGGQQQRALIARSLINHPKLLLLDEPTTGLDSVVQDELYQLLQNFREQMNLTLIVVSHDIGLLTEYVDYLVCLSHTMHWHGHPELLSEETLKEFYGCELGYYFHRHEEHQRKFHSHKDEGL